MIKKLKYNNTKVKGFILTILVSINLFFINIFSIVVNASPFIVETVENAITYEFNRYPLSNYSLDFYYDTGLGTLPWNWQENSVKLLGTVLNMITNVVLGLNNLISYFVGFLVEQAFSLDFITDIISEINPIIRNIIGVDESGFMSNGLLPGFIMLILTVLGAYLVYTGLLKREVTKAFSSVIIFLVVMIGLGSYSLYADKYLLKLNDFSKEVSSSMLNIGNNIVLPEETSEKDAVVLGLRDRLFKIQVLKPYLLLQYGNSNIDEINIDDLNRVSSILSNYPDSEARSEAVKKEVQNGNSNMSISGLAPRLGNVLLMLILNLVLSCIVLLFVGAMLYYQILFLFYALTFPINFVVGMVPGRQNYAIKGIVNLLGAVFKRQGLSLITAMIFTVSDFIYTVSDENKYGFLFVFCIQILLFLVAYMKSNEVLSLFDFAGKHNKGLGYAGHMTNNIINRMRYFNRFNNRYNKSNNLKNKADNERNDNNENNRRDNPGSLNGRNNRIDNTKLKERYKNPTMQKEYENIPVKDKSFMERMGSRTGDLMSARDKIGAKKDYAINKVRRAPKEIKDNIKDNMKNKVGSFKDFKDEYETKRMYEGAKRNLQKRRMNKGNNEKSNTSREKESYNNDLRKQRSINHYDSGKPTVLNLDNDKKRSLDIRNNDRGFNIKIGELRKRRDRNEENFN